MRSFRVLGAVCVIAALPFSASRCARGREYELRGQVLAVDASRQEITIKHDDIRGFMPGMTMPFRVESAALLQGRKPGELIRATLVVEDDRAFLTNIQSTGHAPLAEPIPDRPRIDLLNPGDEVPDSRFVDEHGRARTLADWRGQVLAITFIYTRCPVPDFCPRMDRQFAEVQQAVAGDSTLHGRVRLLSISIDPDFDTSAVLAAHAKKTGADPATWSFLTGTRADVERFAARVGVSIVPDADSAPEILHNLRTAVVDGNGRLVKILSGSDWTVAELLGEIRNASVGG